MTTTLLMIFMAQGTPLDNILSYKYVALEITHTLMGSVGLVLVAPCTALSAVWLLAGRRPKRKRTGQAGTIGVALRLF